MKKGLICLCGPYNLLQGLWFCAEFPERKYDALINKSHLSDETIRGMLQQCEDSGCFETIQTTDGYKQNTVFENTMLMLKMIICYCLGIRSKMTKTIIENAIGKSEYGTVVLTEFSMIGGAFIDHSDQEYEVFIMQDGTADTRERLDYPEFGLKSFVFWLLAKMGYANPGAFYKLDKVKYCSKLTTMRSMLKYKPFKAIIDMNGMLDNPKFIEIVKHAYGIKNLSQERADIILMTTDFKQLGIERTEVEKIRTWLKENYKGKTIAIKKHPRDVIDYFWDDLNVSQIDPSIPAELLLRSMKGKTIILPFISTVLYEIIAEDMDYKVLRFNSVRNTYYVNGFNQYRYAFQIPESRIVDIA